MKRLSPVIVSLLFTFCLITSFVALWAESSGCTQIGANPSTQPITWDERIAAALKNYDTFKAKAEALAKIAMGPNPSQQDIDAYNQAVWYMDVARQMLVILGAPVPADTPPKMLVRRAT